MYIKIHSDTSTSMGFTGGEKGRFFIVCGILNDNSISTKRIRIHNSLAAFYSASDVMN